MKEKGERAEELEMQMQKLERDNESLQKKVASLGITCEKVWCIQVLPGLCFRMLQGLKGCISLWQLPSWLSLLNIKTSSNNSFEALPVALDKEF